MAWQKLGTGPYSKASTEQIKEGDPQFQTIPKPQETGLSFSKKQWTIQKSMYSLYTSSQGMQSANSIDVLQSFTANPTRTVDTCKSHSEIVLAIVLQWSEIPGWTEEQLI